MTVLTWVAIGVIALCAVIGIIRGLTRTLFKLFGFFIVVALAYALCVPFSGIVNDICGDKLEAEAKTYIISLDEGKTEEEKVFTVARDWTDKDNVKDALQIIGIPSLMSGITANLVMDKFQSLGAESVLAEQLPPILTNWATIVISYLILMLLLTIVLIIVRSLLTNLIKSISIANAIDRIGGLLFGAGLGILICSIVLTVMSIIPYQFMEPVNAYIQESVETSPLIAWLTDNFITQFIISVFK